MGSSKAAKRVEMTAATMDSMVPKKVASTDHWKEKSLVPMMVGMKDSTALMMAEQKGCTMDEWLVESTVAKKGWMGKMKAAQWAGKTEMSLVPMMVGMKDSTALMMAEQKGCTMD